MEVTSQFGVVDPPLRAKLGCLLKSFLVPVSYVWGRARDGPRRDHVRLLSRLVSVYHRLFGRNSHLTGQHARMQAQGLLDHGAQERQAFNLRQGRYAVGTELQMR